MPRLIDHYQEDELIVTREGFYILSLPFYVLDFNCWFSDFDGPTCANLPPDNFRHCILGAYLNRTEIFIEWDVVANARTIGWKAHGFQFE